MPRTDNRNLPDGRQRWPPKADEAVRADSSAIVKTNKPLQQATDSVAVGCGTCRFIFYHSAQPSHVVLLTTLGWTLFRHILDMDSTTLPDTLNLSRLCQNYENLINFFSK